MTTEEYNAWAQAQNRQPGSHAEYYLTEPTDAGGTKSVRDPYYTSPEYVNSQQAAMVGGWDAPTEAGATKWTSQSPNDVYYSPTGTEWQPLTAESLTDPVAAQAVMRGTAQGGYGATAFSDLNAQIPEDVRQGIEGSTHSLDPAVMAKMWAPGATEAPVPAGQVRKAT